MSLKAVWNKKDKKITINGSIEQNKEQLLVVGIPIDFMKSGRVRIVPVGKPRIIADEITLYGDVYNTRKFVIFGERRSTLYAHLRAHRFARIGDYNFTIYLYDSENTVIMVECSIQVLAGDEYRPRALEKPSLELLRAADVLEPEVVNSGDKDGAVPVVVAAWRRIDNLPRTISSLKEQTRKSRLILWLNNPDLLPEVRRIIDQENSLHITVYSSQNIGGFGRFYAAKKEDSGVVVMLDDDQVLRPDSIEKLHKVYAPGVMAGQWSFRFRHPYNYWLKYNPKDTAEVDYIGTGGMIVDTSVLRDEKLYTDIPADFWFIEDLWLSWFAVQCHEYCLYSVDAGIKIIKDGKDQMSSLVDRKTEFYRYLTKRGANWSKRMKRMSGYDALTK